MRTEILLQKDWVFTDMDGVSAAVDLPHTWNAIDGQDGGDDYRRGRCRYEKTFAIPEFDREKQCVYLEFQGVNASALVELNGKFVIAHDGGYSTFRQDVTKLLLAENKLTVAVDNGVNDRVYPQKADFTFYGGIYRDVKLIVLNKSHFDLDWFGGPGIAVSAQPKDGKGEVTVRTWHEVENAQVQVKVFDGEGNVVATGQHTCANMTVENVRLWDGIYDPYLYRCEATLLENGEEVDKVSCSFGFRSYHFDPKKGFFLNGRSYPLYGVSRHQDRKGIGNALLREHHDEDMALIRQMGATTIRLAHYQHDQYFYDLCDKYGMVVWAEIPYISEHMPNGRDNTLCQMTELIAQNYNHPSIVTWGISNEITISTKNKKDMLSNHRQLNDLVHKLDPDRPTTLACYAMCGPFNRVAHITDLVSWNLYLGWYVPGLFLNDLWISFFHFVFPKRCLGFSEYGCEGMPNLHSSHPRRGDHTEEYQAIYHEYMLECFKKRPYMWANHVWNMFDFAADARNQGGEPGMNHKGLVTFDRKVKKDSFYLYKAYWNKEPMVHIAGKRYVNRCEKVTTVKVYTNQRSVTLYANGEKIAAQQSKVEGGKVFAFRVPMAETVVLEAVSGELRDTAKLHYVNKPDPAYKLSKKVAGGGNWT